LLCGSSGTAACAEGASEDEGEAGGEANPEITWQDIRQRLRLDSADKSVGLFLELFEERYNVTSPAAALLDIKAFLSVYLIQEFNYRKFCLALGSVSAKVADDDDLFKDHESRNLSRDLGAAAATMLRVAVAVASAFGLRPSDWKDVNEACGKAVRSVPACYRLQRDLPGALNDARSLRFLPVPTTDAGIDLNPWRSEEGRALFAEAHSVEWKCIESLTEKDEKPSWGFTGVFEVVDVRHDEALSFVYLRAVRIGEPPGLFPTKDLQVGDPILWEVDRRLGDLLQPGFVVDAVWFELPSEVCFVSTLESVAPPWAP